MQDSMAALGKWLDSVADIHTLLHNARDRIP